MAVEWFYQVMGETVGPVSGSELRSLAKTGTVTPFTLIRRGPNGKWVLAREVKGLFGHAGVRSSEPAAPSKRLPTSPPAATGKPPPLPPSACGSAKPSSDAVRDENGAGRLWGMRPLHCVFIAGGMMAVVLLAGALLFFGGGDSGSGGAEKPVAQKESRAKEEVESFQPPEGGFTLLDEPSTFRPPPPSEDRMIAPPGTVTLPATNDVRTPGEGAEPEKDLSAEELFARASPAVASLAVKDDLGRSLGSGSGFFVPIDLPGDALAPDRTFVAAKNAVAKDTKHWFLLTNYHVIKAAVDCDIELADGREGWVLKVVAEDEKADLSLLYVVVRSGMPVATLSLDEGGEPSIGETVYAIGSPKGLRNSLSKGMVSGKRQIVDGVSWLQTTAPISPGSSGGPLLNTDGKVVGVVTASRVEGQNLNFAVPVSAVRYLLKGPAKRRKLWQGASIDEEERYAYDIEIPVWVDVGSGGEAQDEASRRARRESVAPLDKARECMKGGEYGNVIQALADVSPSFPEEWKYLLLFTIGKAHRKLLREQLLKKSTIQEFRDSVRANRHFVSAIQSLERSIELNPRFSPAYSELHDCHVMAGQWSEGLIAAESLVKLVPRCNDAYTKRGRCFYELKKHESALRDLKTAVELNPNDGWAYLLMAYTYHWFREYPKEIEAYERAIEQEFIADWSCYFNMAQTHRVMGQYEEAIKAFRKAGSAAGFPNRYSKEIADCEARIRQRIR